jgi:peptide/nickel transport system substrate-binding protein
MLKGLAAVLAALALAVQAGAQVRNPETFVYAITGDVDSLDPHWQFDSVSQELAIHLYDALINFKGAAVDQFEPSLSTMVPSRENGLLSEDGLRYAFPIRKGVKFHDGSTLTPEDVKYSIMRAMLLDRSGGGSYLLLEPLLGVQTTLDEDGKPVADLWELAEDAIKIERGAVVIKLKKAYAPLLSVLATYSPVVSKQWMTAKGAWDGKRETWIQHRDIAREQSPLFLQANGTGPFMLERWDRENKQLLLSRFDPYWRGAAKLKRLVFKTVNDPAARKLMLQAGDADAVMAERQYLPQFSSIEQVTVIDDLSFLETHNFFAFNFKIDPTANPYVGSGRLDGDGIPGDFFTDPDVRRGFAYAFDYDAYIRDGYRGKGEVARGPIPKGVFGYNSRQVTMRHDPQKAEQHFRRAQGGAIWEKGFRFTLTYMEGRADRQLACVILKHEVEKLNPKFKIDIRGVQWSTWLSAFSQRKIPMSNTRWHMDYPDAHNAVFPLMHSQGYYAKLQGYSNPRVDRLIEQARVEQDLDKRRVLYRELQATAHTELPQIYTLDTYFFQVHRSWVKNWTFNPITLYGYLYPVSKEAP